MQEACGDWAGTVAYALARAIVHLQGRRKEAVVACEGGYMASCVCQVVLPGWVGGWSLLKSGMGSL